LLSFFEFIKVSAYLTNHPNKKPNKKSPSLDLKEGL